MLKIILDAENVMKERNDIDDILDMASESAIRFDNLDEAVVGIDHNGYLVYDYDTMHRLFMSEGMDEEEACEWIEYNVLVTNAGNGFSILYMRRNEDI